MTHCSITGGKILSCCYCGVQSRFLPMGQGGGGKAQVTALVCGTCGAPLAAQKARPLAAGKGASLPPQTSPGIAKPKVKKRKGAKAYQPARTPARKPQKVKPRKKRKSLFQKLVSEAVDLVEDIFD